MQIKGPGRIYEGEARLPVLVQHVSGMVILTEYSVFDRLGKKDRVHRFYRKRGLVRNLSLLVIHGRLTALQSTRD